ncbi:MAG: hypothetical protein AAFO87_14450 [Cyanobacteria bacterium J06607_6]
MHGGQHVAGTWEAIALRELIPIAYTISSNWLNYAKRPLAS